MTTAKRGAFGEGTPLSGDGLLGGETIPTIRQSPSRPQAPSKGGALRSHFDRAVVLLEQKAELAADTAEWRDQARSDGLDAAALLQIAKEQLQDAEQRRKAAERAQTEALYRNGLGLPLFDHAMGRSE